MPERVAGLLGAEKLFCGRTVKLFNMVCTGTGSARNLGCKLIYLLSFEEITITGLELDTLICGG